MKILVDSQKFLIYGQSRDVLYSSAARLEVSALAFRLVVFMAFFAYLAVYSTGYLRPLLGIFSLPLVVLVFRGRPLVSPLAVMVSQLVSVISLLYALWQRSGPVPGIVVLIEFTSIILLLHIATMKNLRAVYGGLILSLMIILAVAAMNVNFIFPLILVPYLFSFFLTLRWISGFRHGCVSRHRFPENAVFRDFRGQGLGFLISVSVFAIMWLVLFYFIPRTESLGLASEASKRRLKGFSDTLSLGEPGLLEDNPAVVMRLRPIDERTSSPSIIRRLRSRTLRGTTFALYRNGQWERGRKRRWHADLRRNQGEVKLIDDLNLQRDIHPFEIILENTEPPLIFVPDQTTELSIGLSFIGVEEDRTLYFLNRVSGSRRYLANLILNPLEVQDSNVGEVINERGIQTYLSTSGIPERLSNLASQLASGTQTYSERVNRAMSFLQRQCVYSLTQSDVQGMDPVEFFLFENKSGSCEHFATALALMLRAMQIPARPVSGYTMGEWNDVGKFFTVRQGHAHTWVEVFFPASGWVPFDPTPPALDREAESEVEKIFQSLWETYEGYWFSYVYSFDNRSQNLGFRRILAALSERLHYLSDWLLNPVYLLILGGTVFFFGRRIRFMLAKLTRSSTWIPLWYLEWEARLPLSRRTFETPADFHKRLFEAKTISPEDYENLQKVAEIINIVAFNGSADVDDCRSRGLDILKEVKIR